MRKESSGSLHVGPILIPKALDQFLDKISGVEFVLEPQSGPYGNGTPLIVARSHIPKDAGFIYAYGDDLIKSKTPFARALIDKHNRTGALVAGTQQVPWEEKARTVAAVWREAGSQLNGKGQPREVLVVCATHQEIANRIGTTRETVTRMLKDLERQGLVRVEGREIVLQPGFERAFD